jgi:RNA polymerase sigma-70 factor, ECF subfamily
MFDGALALAVIFGSQDDDPRWHPDDTGLLARVRDGDRTAFDDIVRAHFDVLYRFARGRLGDVESAEDVLQDVLWRMWDQRDRLTVHTSIRAYLFRSVRNAIADVRRHDHIVHAHAERVLLPTEVPRRERPDAQYEIDELRVALTGAIATLPERTREAYLLYHQSGLSYAEIAETMGISVKGVEFQMGKALRQLREALAQFAPVETSR